MTAFYGGSADTTAQMKRRYSECRAPVPVVSEEDVVALIVQRHHPPAPELGVEVEQGGQHAAHPVPEHGGEVVQHHLGPVVRELLDPLPEAPESRRVS